VPLAVAVAPVRVAVSNAVCPTTIEVAERVVVRVGFVVTPCIVTETIVELVMPLLVPPVPVNVTEYNPAVVPVIVTFTFPVPP
jgi:hypothetical protein